MRNVPFEAPVKIVTFFNYLDEPFTFYWAKTPYTLQPGEKMRMEDWKAKHAALHLADRWCMINKRDNRHSEDFFKAKMDEAIIEEGKPVATTSGEISKLRTELLSEEKPAALNIVSPEAMQELKPEAPKKKVLCVDCGSTGPRHKKACPKKQPHAALA